MNAVVSASRLHFQTFADVQEYLAEQTGRQPFDFPRDAPGTLTAADELGVGPQVAEAIELSRVLDPVIDASVERAKCAAPRERAKSFAAARVATSSSPIDWPAALDLEVMAENEPEAPRFILPGWGPAGYAWLLAGHGGAGKSFLLLMLAVCLAAGVPFLGLVVERRRRVMLLSCEDRANVLHWRLSRICAYLGVDLANLRGWLEIVDLVGHDCVLWAPGHDSVPWAPHLRVGRVLTAAYCTLAERVEQHQTEVLMVDGVSDTFGGNENSRSEVKRYVNALVALIPPDGAAVLNGHVDKNTARAGSAGDGYSGSTGWHNAVRARWYLYPESHVGDEGERTARTGNLILELQKTNHGRVDQSIRITWDEQAQLFTGHADSTATALDRAHQEREERDGIILALKACAARDYVPAATSGRRTAYNVLTAAREFPDSLRKGKPAIRRFWQHVEALRHRGDIIEGEHRGRDRHRIAILVAAGNAGNVE